MDVRPVRWLLALVAAVVGSSARATLGEPDASISTDQAALEAKRSPGTTHAAYRVEHLASDVRSVREYVSPAGVVFAVSWEGLSHPDLNGLLGRYAAPIRQALAGEGPAPRRRSRRVEAAGAVVETWGHMRAVRGRAYVPALVPAGINLDDIR
jgi:hypothetical protein